MIHCKGWYCTVTSLVEININEIVETDDTWHAPGEWVLEHLDMIINWYGDQLVSIKLEPDVGEPFERS